MQARAVLLLQALRYLLMSQGHGSPVSSPTFKARGCASRAAVRRLCRVCHVRSPRAAGLSCWEAEESPRVPMGHIICRPGPQTTYSRAGAVFSQAPYFEAAPNMNVI